MTRVLLVEDDAALAQSLRVYLEREGFTVTVAATLAAAKREPAHDVIILDWMLPDGQGIDWLHELRRRGDPARVLMLTARADVVDRIVGLESGANDYLTKPFEPRELVARVRVQAREKDAKPSAKNTVRAGPLALDLDERTCTWQGRDVPLAKMEFELLKLLAATPGKVFSREELLNQVWGFEAFPTTRTVDTHVLQLRTKLSADLIETVRGVGYRFRRELTP